MLGLVLVLLVLARGSQAEAATLVAHWSFDEPNGTVAHDATGNYDGTLAGSAAFVPGGISGNALTLDATTGDLVDVGPSFPGFTSGDFSLVAWVKTTTTDQNTNFLSKHTSGFLNGYFLSLNRGGPPPGFGYGQDDKAWFYDSDTTGAELTTTISVNDDSWHQIVGVYVAGGNKTIYVDGGLDGTKASVAIIGNTAQFLIGGISVAGTPTGNYTGLLDEVRVYSGALNAEEVGALFVEPGVTTTTTTTSTTSSSSSSTSSAQVTTTVATTTTTTTLPPVCLGGTTISKVAIVVKKVGAPPGDERVSFKGALAFAAGTPAIFDPANKGAQVLIEDVGADDAPILALTHLTNPVPPGVGCAGDGWKKTTYKNGSGAIDPPVCTAGSAGGLKKLKLKDKRAKGKGIAFKVTTKGSTVATIVGPLRGTIVLGATVAESLAGECGVHEFASASCRQKKTTVTCK